MRLKRKIALYHFPDFALRLKYLWVYNCTWPTKVPIKYWKKRLTKSLIESEFHFSPTHLVQTKLNISTKFLFVSIMEYNWYNCYIRVKKLLKNDKLKKLCFGVVVFRIIANKIFWSFIFTKLLSSEEISFWGGEKKKKLSSLKTELN